MAKITLLSALAGLSGSFDNLVFKQYRKDKRGGGVTRKPDMSKGKPSAAQLARRELMRAAGFFHRRGLADPVLLGEYTALARPRRVHRSAATMGDHIHQGGQPAQECK